MKNVLLLAALILIVVTAAYPAAPGPKLSDNNGVNDNKHNLSVNSQASFRATDASDPKARQICIFCHTPHNSAPQTPLWNHKETTQSFGHYSSQSLKIHTDPATRSAADYKLEPNGSSRLCLGCHDGVTALGALQGGAVIEINNSFDTAMSGGRSFDRDRTTNSHHPVSFIYNANVRDKLKALEPLNGYKLPSDPVAAPEVKLDREGRMQCTTCHDPHQSKTDASLTPFWVVAHSDPQTAYDRVCNACHNFSDFPHD